MKLLCVVPSYWPAFQYGGPIISVHGLNKIIAIKGVDVTVYTTNVGLGDRVVVNQEVEIDGVRVIYFAFANYIEFIANTGWQFSWQMARALKKNLKKFDIVYLPAVWNFTTAAAAYYCRRYKKPYIISPRGVLYPYTVGNKAWKKRPYYILFAKRDIDGAAIVHYTTEDEMQKCHSYLGLKSKAMIIPNGLEENKFIDLTNREKLRNPYPNLKDKKVIFFLGRIHWIKGMDILSKAFAKITKERENVHLLIAGPDDDGYIKKVLKWFDDEGVTDKVTFTGMLRGKEKLEAFASSNLFVLPSYSENFGMAAIEAMACGLPVVISDRVGIHRDVEQAGAGLIIHPDSESLYKALIRLLDNSDDASDMGRRGRELVKDRFTIESVADRTIKMFKRVISDG